MDGGALAALVRGISDLDMPHGFEVLLHQASVQCLCDTRHDFRRLVTEMEPIGVSVEVTKLCTNKDHHHHLLGEVDVPCSQVQTTTLAISFGSSEISTAATKRTT